MIDRYAAALFETTEAEDGIEKTQKELSVFKELLNSDYHIRDFLCSGAVETEEKKKALEVLLLFRILIHHLAVKAEEKKKVLEDTLKGKVSDTFLTMARLIVDFDEAELFGQIVDKFTKLVAQKKELILVEVVSAVRLSDDLIEEIKERVRPLIKGEPVIYNSVDESIIGGVIIKIGDKLFDGSIRARLQEIKGEIFKLGSGVS
jgi:F-type H+-transporting ATPase subunit delta